MDFNPSKQGLQWSPYAAAIAEHYKQWIPLYQTIPTGLTAAGQQVYVQTDSLQYDALILGAMILIETSAAASDNGQNTFLNVYDSRNGLSWVAPGFPDAIPATAFGGVAGQPMPVLPLPEAYFLPAGAELIHVWNSYVAATSGGSLTWVGVQLIDPIEGKAPECVDVDGCSIRVGGRMPWFDAIGLGLQAASSGLPTFSLVNNIQFRGFSSAQDCDIEIHSLEANFFTVAGVSVSPDLIRLRISDTGDRRMDSLNFAPSPAVLGSYTQGTPALPLTRPYLLKAGRKLKFDLFNTSGADLNNGYLTIRGVRRCAY